MKGKCQKMSGTHYCMLINNIITILFRIDKARKVREKQIFCKVREKSGHYIFSFPLLRFIKITVY